MGLVRSDAATSTYGALHLYANSSTGNDANDGRTAATAVQTLLAVCKLVPTVLYHSVVVHLEGTFANPGYVTLSVMFARATDVNSETLPRLIIDGGTSYSILDDNGGSNFAATGSSTTTLTATGVSGMGHTYYWVEVLTGPAAGQVRTVLSQSVNTVTVQNSFSIDPGVGATFRFVYPSTILTATSGGAQALSISATGNCGTVSVQGLYIQGDRFFLDIRGCSGQVLISNCIVGSTNDYPITATACNGLTFWATAYNTTTFATQTARGAGVSSPGTPKLKLTDCVNVSLLHLLYGGLEATNSSFSLIFSTDWNSTTCVFDGCYITSFLGVNTFHDGTASGVQFKNTTVASITGTFTARDNAAHGIDVWHSYVNMAAAVAGTGNTGAGVYAHDGSVVRIAAGTPPTVTGTVGDLAITSAAAADSTWAAVAGGSPVSSSPEMTLCKAA